MRTAFLLFIATPGSFALIAIALRELIRAVRKSRSESEDAERALRIQRDYMIPDWAVEVSEPTGKRAEPKVDWPEVFVRHDRVWDDKKLKGMN